MVLPMIFRGVWLLNNYPYSSNCFQPNRSYRTVVVISILRVLFTDTNMFLSFRSLILILFSLSFMKTNIKLTIHSITLDSWIGSLSASFLIISSKLFFSECYSIKKSICPQTKYFSRETKKGLFNLEIFYRVFRRLFFFEQE